MYQHVSNDQIDNINIIKLKFEIIKNYKMLSDKYMQQSIVFGRYMLAKTQKMPKLGKLCFGPNILLENTLSENTILQNKLFGKYTFGQYSNALTLSPKNAFGILFVQVMSPRHSDQMSPESLLVQRQLVGECESHTHPSTD